MYNKGTELHKNVLNKLSELLNQIEQNAIETYKNTMQDSIEYVNKQIKLREDFSILTGSNPTNMIEDNHQNHAHFMYNIFLTKDTQNMFDTYIWAYNTYHSRGFVFRYFYLELAAWKESLEHIDKDSLSSIIELYDYLISLHDYFVQHASTVSETLPHNIDEHLYNNFLDALLNFDLNKALQISHEYIKKDVDIKSFWEHIILPALYSVGNKWANGEISVGEEHTATSICQRIMSEHYEKVIKHIKYNKNILVTTSPNELHEVGTRMLADILELNGYEVTYLSSGTTKEEILDTIYNEDIKYAVISTTLVSNIEKTKDLVAAIREQFTKNPPKIIVGGQAYTNNHSASELVKADYFLTNSNAILEVLKEET